MTKVFRRLLVCTILLLITGVVETSAKETDSIPKPKYDSVMKLSDSLRKADSAKAVALKTKETATNPKKDSTSTCGCVPDMKGEVKGVGWILTFLPAIIFTGLLAWSLNTKDLKSFNLKEAMSENAYPTVLVDNPQYNATNLAALVTKENVDDILPPTVEKTFLIKTQVGTAPNIVTVENPPPPNPSISRYIAFITSILTLVAALGVSCFYIYHYVRTGCPPELTGISTLLIALGIGVMPYVFNKLAGAIGKQNSND